MTAELGTERGGAMTTLLWPSWAVSLRGTKSAEAGLWEMKFLSSFDFGTRNGSD